VNGSTLHTFVYLCHNGMPHLKFNIEQSKVFEVIFAVFLYAISSCIIVDNSYQVHRRQPYPTLKYVLIRYIIVITLQNGNGPYPTLKYVLIRYIIVITLQNGNDNNNNNNLHHIKNLIVRNMEFPHNISHQYTCNFELC